MIIVDSKILFSIPFGMNRKLQSSLIFSSIDVVQAFSTFNYQIMRLLIICTCLFVPMPHLPFYFSSKTAAFRKWVLFATYMFSRRVKNCLKNRIVQKKKIKQNAVKRSINASSTPLIILLEYCVMKLKWAKRKRFFDGCWV